MFALAREYGIPLHPRDAKVLRGKAVLEFCRVYEAWAAQRDSALTAYLGSDPRPFRAFLPYDHDLLNTAPEVMWYLDEILIPDPIVDFANYFRSIRDGPCRERWPSFYESYGELQGKPVPVYSSYRWHLDQGGPIGMLEKQVRYALQFLNHFRPAIEAGHLLLAGDGVLPHPSEHISAIARPLLEDPVVVDTLRRNVRFAATTRPDSLGRNAVLHTASVGGITVVGLKMRPLRGADHVYGPEFTLGEELPTVSAGALGRRLGRNAYEATHIGQMYAQVVERTLYGSSIAHSLGSAALFSHAVQDAILSRARLPHVADAQAPLLGLRLSLPYLRGATPERLLALRDKTPESFRYFRSRISDIVHSAMGGDAVDSARTAAREVEREISASLVTLQNDLEAVARRSRILGYGGAAVAAVGSLAGAALGPAAATAIVTCLVARTTAALTAAADSGYHRAKLKTNPFYFVWHAQRTARRR
jgi:hypothetical protein